jgi:translation initiation factor IF-2
MGHIDHGKSTLLDYIRKTNIVDKEAGGITQHISAYEVVHTTSEGKTGSITFLDTPGHEAFQKMRERGANVADIAVLVVSAEDGVKKQTLEAWNAIKSSGVPYIVAINKIDKPNADLEKTKLSLAEHGIYLEGYGGDISYVAVSAKTGVGINELLDMLVLTADIGGFTGMANESAEGFIIETEREAKSGISATLVIKNGTLKTGMCVVCDTSISPVRMMENFLGKKITEASFSSPVRLTGWDSVPPVGEIFRAFPSKKDAEKAVAETKQAKPTKKTEAANEANNGKKIIPIVVKSDAVGSAEAIEHELQKINQERVAVKIIYCGIGDITETDVKAVSGTENAVVLGFNVRVDAQAKALSERTGIPVLVFDIIYKLTEWIDEHLKANAPKVEVEEIVSEAKVLKLFSKIKDKQILGGRVLKGEFKLGVRVKIMRREVLIGEGVVRELQKQKDKASEVQEGFEFGACVESKIELAPGDVMAGFITVEK